MEKLAGDLLLGFKFVKLPILPTLFIQFVQSRLGELGSGYLGLEGLIKHNCKTSRKEMTQTANYYYEIKWHFMKVQASMTEDTYRTTKQLSYGYLSLISFLHYLVAFA